MDEELAGWVERVFSQFRNIGLALGWEDPATGLAFERPSRLPAVRSGPYGDTQAEGIHSLAPLNEDVPEQVLKFAPKKVRNVGSVHPARTALRAAITELEAAKARHNQLLQAEQQAAELDSHLHECLPRSVREIERPRSTKSNMTKVLQRRNVGTRASFSILRRGGR